jgi:transposase-like protein
MEIQLDSSYRTVRRRVELAIEALNVPSITSGPVEINGVYASAGLKGRERDQESRSEGLSTRGRGAYGGNKPPVFRLVDHGPGDWYGVPAKFAEASTVQLLLAKPRGGVADRLHARISGLRPTRGRQRIQPQYVIHCNGEYADAEIHVNSCETHVSLTRRWLSPHRGVSKDKLTPYRKPSNFAANSTERQGDEGLKHALAAAH